jgi:WD40 repeat protein
VELYDARKSTVVAAHESDLARLALSGDGSLLATASDKGTLIRVFDAHSGAQLREFRRGVDRALVYSIVFCPETKYLACSSDKGTVHVFNLKSEGGRVVAPNACGPASQRSIHIARRRRRRAGRRTDWRPTSRTTRRRIIRRAILPF